MAWAYLPASEDSNLDSSDQEFVPPWRLLKRTNIARRSLSSDFQKSRSGTMSPPLTGAPGRAELILSAEGFLVRISAEQEKGPDSKRELEAVCGLSSCELSAKFDPASRLLRMSHSSLFAEEPESLLILPRSGIILNGSLYPLLQWERPTCENESLSWPTPRVSDTEGGIIKNAEFKDGSWSRVNRKGIRFGIKLKDAVAKAEKMWPTPRAHEVGQYTRDRGKKGKERLTLTGAAKMWPTPKGSPSGPDYARRNREGSGGDDLVTAIGGQLNPMWVEWLMGFPLGWTDLNVSETQLSHNALNISGG